MQSVLFNLAFMKYVARLLLFLFVSFLLTPIVIKLIENKCDTSEFFNFSEEETIQKEVKLFTHLYNVTANLLPIEQVKSGLVLFENLSKHINVSKSIFSPPPDIS